MFQNALLPKLCKGEAIFRVPVALCPKATKK